MNSSTAACLTCEQVLGLSALVVFALLLQSEAQKVL